ncbi:hypothetical protein CS022_14695 [Veronia nyctiphanis]|uniref:Uncharacterized protein n=1 Tax=Veronia nyctiphanis TaxID=1278244 RepID=A0A4Q0YNN0_9GAMM|nr:Ig-like domain-containing protein [Veronia nyctiphanis]RXJ72557.1 hypothetical protein CS022_14695 [Veronia nyctiphanis]
MVFVDDNLGETQAVNLTKNGSNWEANPFDISSLSDGTVTVKALVTDNAGNTKEVTNTLELDKTVFAPDSVSIVEDTNGDGFLKGSEYKDKVQISVDLPSDAVANDIITINGEDTTLTQAHIDSGEFIKQLDSPAEGETLNVSVTITDQFGNVSTVAKDSVKRDTMADADGNLTLNIPNYLNLTSEQESTSVDITLTGVDADVTTVTAVFSDGKDSVEGTLTKGTDGTWFINADLSDLDDGNIEITATVTDEAGNTAQATESLVLDTVADEGVAFDVVIGSDYLITNDEQKSSIDISFVGADKDVDTISVTFTDKNNKEITLSPTKQGETSWVFDPAPNLTEFSDGPITISTLLTDLAGNTKEVTKSLTLDTTADENDDLSVVVDAQFDVTNLSEVNDVTVTLSGVDTHDTKSVVVTFEDNDGTTVTTAAALENGEWVIDAQSLSSLAQGPVSVTTVVTDNANNTATASDTLEIDTVIDENNDFDIAAILGDRLANLVESGHVELTVDGLDDDITVFDITFTDTDGNTVNAEVNKSGSTWTIEPTDISELKDGQITIKAAIQDDAGNSTEIEREMTLDKTADADNNFAVEMSSTDGTVNAEEESNVKINLVGIDKDADTVVVQLTDKNGKVQDVTVSENNGVWSIPEFALNNLADGNVDVKATVTDAAGNTKTVTTQFDLDTHVDTGEAFAVVISDEFETVNMYEVGDVQIGVAGVDDDITEMTVNYVQGGKRVEGEAYQTDGNWFIRNVDLTDEFNDGPVEVVVAISDDAGNSTEQRAELSLDTTPPAAPRVKILDRGDDEYINANEYDSKAQVEVTFGSDVVAGDIISINSNVEYKVKASDLVSKKVVIDIDSVENGQEQVASVIIKDAAGNRSDATKDKAMVDTTIALDGRLDEDFDGGFESDDGLTNIPTPTFSGVSDPGASIMLTIDGQDIPVTANETTGAWSVTVPNLEDDTYEYSVVATDAAGNSTSLTGQVEIETTAPTTLTASLHDDIDTGVKDDQLTNSVNPKLSGSVEAGCRVKVEIDGQTYDATVTGSTWEVGPFNALAANQSHDYKVIATDIYGNVKELNQSLSIDTVAPTVTSDITPGAQGSGINIDEPTNTINSKGPAFNGTVDNDINTVTVTFNGKDYPAAVDSAEGTWSINAVDLVSTDGTYNYSVKAVDKAGNSTVENFKVIVDTQAAVTLNLADASDTAGWMMILSQRTISQNWHGLSSTVRVTRVQQ